MHILTIDSGITTIQFKELAPEATRVYNFEVANNHAYYVGVMAHIMGAKRRG